MSATCPNCGRPADLSTNNPARPFCCERCRLADLSKWLDEEYVISEPAPELVRDDDEG